MEFVFKDISESAKILAQDKWSTGVTYADINNDNLLDIYVCAAMYKENRRNMLFINKGVNPETGIINFEEKAWEKGISFMMGADSCASWIPLGVNLTSCQPVNKFFSLYVDSPCRINTRCDCLCIIIS